MNQKHIEELVAVMRENDRRSKAHRKAKAELMVFCCNYVEHNKLSLIRATRSEQ